MKVRQTIENILRDNELARNSDRELIILFMRQYGMDLSMKQEELFREMPSVETIRRTRQDLQEQGKYPASEAVNEARYSKFKEVRANIIDEDPVKLLEKRGYRIVSDEENARYYAELRGEA